MAYTTIDKPSDYFETVTYTGNTSSGTTISSLDFAPNMVWFKSRTNAENHQIYDSVRGVTKRIIPNGTQAEATASTGLTNFDSNGFRTGGENETDSGNIVAWNWKAGTSVSGNTTGSGTAKTYTGSVNTDAGFSIIKYTGNASSGHTIPHNLGVVPKAMIIKSLAATQSWFINFPFGTGAGYIMLDRTNAGDGSNNSVWNSTAPSSSVVTLGETGGVNENNDAYIMYAFAEKQGYSKFGSYTGNGNADGTFVYLGFKPAFVITKLSSSAGEGWEIYNNKALGYNVDNNKLVANTSGAESTADRIDLLSNGFKARINSDGINKSGDTLIYMAFAESPFVSSTGVPATAR